MFLTPQLSNVIYTRHGGYVPTLHFELRSTNASNIPTVHTRDMSHLPKPRRRRCGVGQRRRRRGGSRSISRTAGDNAPSASAFGQSRFWGYRCGGRHGLAADAEHEIYLDAMSQRRERITGRACGAFSEASSLLPCNRSGTTSVNEHSVVQQVGECRRCIQRERRTGMMASRNTVTVSRHSEQRQFRRQLLRFRNQSPNSKARRQPDSFVSLRSFNTFSHLAEHRPADLRRP